MKRNLLLGLSLLALVAAVSTVALAKEPRAIVKVTNFEFNPKELTIPVGYTVIWQNEVGKHTIVADDGSFKSETLNKGETFTHKFEKAGTYHYYCSFHGAKGGHEMAATVVVGPNPKP